MEPAIAALYKKAEAHIERQELAEAEACYKEVIRTYPAEGSAYYQWALLACQAKNFFFAKGLVTKAVEVSGNAELYAHFAVVVAKYAQHALAIQMCDLCIAANPPGHKGAWLNRGIFLNDMGRSAEALESFEKADAAAELEGNPPADFLHLLALNRGVTYMNRGELARAKESYLEAIKHNPEDGVPYRYLAQVVRFGEEDTPLMEDMIALAEKKEKAGVPEDEICFAVGKGLNDLKRYDEAFQWFKKGNDLLCKKSDPKKHTDFWAGRAKELKEVFTPAFFERVKDAGNPSRMPIFIVGLPRSGTTLLEQILAGHPEVTGVGELPYMENLSQGITDLLKSEKPYPQCLEGELPMELLRDIGGKYLLLLESLAEGRPYIANKMPYNFWHLGLIAMLLPNARILHLTRDPMDNALSNYFVKFMTGGQWSTSLEGYAAYYKTYCSIMEHWKQVLPIKIYELSYEALVNDLESEAKKVIAYCGLEWSDKCLDFQEGSGHVKTASAYQVRQKLYTSSVGRWKKYEQHLGPLKKALAP